MSSSLLPWFAALEGNGHPRTLAYMTSVSPPFKVQDYLSGGMAQRIYLHPRCINLMHLIYKDSRNRCTL